MAWGGFYLRQGRDGWRVVDDDDLPDGRTSGGTIGAESAPYGLATVEVFDDERRVATSSTGERNHVWVDGLEPDHEYRYRVTVNGTDWAGGERWGWQLGPATGGLAPSGRRYDQRLRTHPHAEADVPVAVLAVGDYGVGIVNGDDGRRQLAVARTMERLAANRSVRAIVSLGDNIYHGPEDQLAQTGAEDDDWYFTFYEPYRYLIDHLPLYPAAGNHDGADEELNDDRAQLADNFHLESRFRGAAEEGRAPHAIPACSIESRSAGCWNWCASTRLAATGRDITTSTTSGIGNGSTTHSRRPASGPRGSGSCRLATTRRGALVRTTPAWSSSSTA